MYLMNYNFMADKDVIDPAPARITTVTGAQLSNAVFDHFNLLNSGDYTYDTEIPAEWTNKTVLNADFNGNINAGSISYSTEDLAGVRIKRRVKGTFSWLTLYDLIATDPADLVFTKYDITNKTGVTYEYAIVPYLTDGSETSYIIKEVESFNNGVFVCSPTSIAKFYGGLAYSGFSRINKTGVFEPLGTKYPVIVSNADTNYVKGSINATAMGFEQLLLGNYLNRTETSQYTNSLTNFLSDKTAKIIKDWNGNLWLTAITSDIGVNYNNAVGMGVADISFNFVEIGDAEDQSTLEQNGFINIEIIAEHFPNQPNPELRPAHNPDEATHFTNESEPEPEIRPRHNPD